MSRIKDSRISLFKVDETETFSGKFMKNAKFYPVGLDENKDGYKVAYFLVVEEVEQEEDSKPS